MAKRAIEQTGLIPRSIIRTFERFKKQLFPGSEMLVIQEFRISRYQVIVSVQCLVTLIFVPLLVNILSKVFFITPLVEYVWNKYQNEIFLNIQQQNSALAELKSFEEKIYYYIKYILLKTPYNDNSFLLDKFKKSIMAILNYNYFMIPQARRKKFMNYSEGYITNFLSPYPNKKYYLNLVLNTLFAGKSAGGL
jgi:flagellar biosynthesis protein FliQ